MTLHTARLATARKLLAHLRTAPEDRAIATLVSIQRLALRTHVAAFVVGAGVGAAAAWVLA